MKLTANGVLLRLLFIFLVTACACHPPLKDANSVHRYEWFSNDSWDDESPVLWGLKDSQTGKIIFTPRFRASSWRDGGDRFGTELHNGKAWVCENDQVELINTKGEILKSLRADNIYPWHDDLLKISAYNACGLITENGDMVLEIKYGSISDLSEGMAVISMLGKDHKTYYGYINDQGKVVIPPTFGSACGFSEGLANVNGDPARFIDKTGKVVCIAEKGCPIGMMGRFHDGLCAVYTYEDGWGFIDKTGKVVIPIIYGEVSSFEGGRAWVGIPTDETRGYCNWVLIDKNGNHLTSPDFCGLCFPPFTTDDQRRIMAAPGVYRYWKNKLREIYAPVGLISSEGKILCENKYYEIKNFVGGLAVVDYRRNGKFGIGLIDLQGREILKPDSYSEITPLENGTAKVTKDGKTAIIDHDGKFLTQFH